MYWLLRNFTPHSFLALAKFYLLYFGTRLTDLLKIFNLKMWYFLRHLRQTEFILDIKWFRSPFGYANPS